MIDNKRFDEVERALAWLIDEANLMLSFESHNVKEAIKFGNEAMKAFDDEQNATAAAAEEERRVRATLITVEEEIENER